MIYLPTYEVARTACNKSLEGMKEALGLSPTAQSSLANGVGGATASLASAAIAVPLDVISQRVMIEKVGPSASVHPSSASAARPHLPTGAGGGVAQPAMATPSSSQPTAAVMSGGSSRGNAGAMASGKSIGGNSIPRGLSTQAASHAGLNGASMARHILRTEGVGGLYRGFGMSILTYTPSSAMWWAAYSVYQDLVWGALHDSGVSVRNDDAWSITGVQAFCGMLAGTTSSIIT